MLGVFEDQFWMRDGLKSDCPSDGCFVTPAKAGVHVDSGFRRNDGKRPPGDSDVQGRSGCRTSEEKVAANT